MEKKSATSMLLLLMAFAFLLDHSAAASFHVVNSCPYTVWAAAKPGGGSRLDTGGKWTLNVNETDPDGLAIWGRTGCTFDAHGRGGCETGDCGGFLECVESGKPPKTLAEFYMYDNTYSDITLVNGFNVPMTFRPDSSCPEGTRACAADINGLCPSELKAPGGCNNPCTVFNTTAYCEDHTATDFSKFFKDSCPHAYAYPGEFYSPSLTASCPPETNYIIEFCPPAAVGQFPLEMA